jgi:PPP family 3-phenylpropionic acid transporter
LYQGDFRSAVRKINAPSCPLDAGGQSDRSGATTGASADAFAACMMQPSSGFARFIALYGALFAGFGVVSPFLGAFLASRGLPLETIGLVLGCGTAVRLAAGPIGGQIADRLGAPRRVMVVYAAVAALVGLAYLPARGAWPLLCVSMAAAAMLAPITALADALTLAAAAASRQAGRPRNRGFDYGWVRGAGSAAFILGTVLGGMASERYGLNAIIWLNGGLLACAAGCGLLVPDVIRSAALDAAPPTGGVMLLLRVRLFRQMLLTAALIQGSHAMHDGFVVIHWRTLGIGNGTIGLLWSESVASEIVVFLLIGRPLVTWLGAAGASVLSAIAGILRWAVLAQSTSVTGFALVEPLHGLTFALQHLACMRLIGMIVPPRFAATAQAFYGTVAVGIASAMLTVVSGPLYARFGAGGFWAMGALCLAAIPAAWSLRRRPADAAT